MTAKPFSLREWKQVERVLPDDVAAVAAIATVATVATVATSGIADPSIPARHTPGASGERLTATPKSY